eukprot:gene1701-biopygen3121
MQHASGDNIELILLLSQSEDLQAEKGHQLLDRKLQQPSTSSAATTAAAAMAAAAAASRKLTHKAAAALFPQQQTEVPFHAPSTSLAGGSPATAVVRAQDGVAGTADWRRQMQARNHQPASHLTSSRYTAVTAAPGMGSSSGLQEQCPQCGAGFESVVELIAHADAVHSATRMAHYQPQLTPVAASVAVEQFSCPSCNAAFGDAVLLVAHHQQCRSRMHQQRQQNSGNQQGHTTCVVS